MDSSGILYDSGGLNGDYQNGESCTLLVSSPCAILITMTFTQFSTEMGYDFLQIWDGTSTSGTQLLNLSGDTLPSAITSTSGSMYIIWTSDFSGSDAGFAATWTSVNAGSGAPPVAYFSISDTTPALTQVVYFTDSTSGQPFSWYWDFGDGDTSHVQHLDHVYNVPGIYTVTLITSNCTDSDTSTGTVNVSCAPLLSVSPSTLIATAHCDTSVEFTIQIINHSVCEAIYDTYSDKAHGDTVALLAMTYGVDQFIEFPNTIDAIQTYFTKFILTTTSTTTPSVLTTLLADKEVLLIPENETGSASVWLTLAPVIQGFLSSGGSVVWCGSGGGNSQSMLNTGVWSGMFDSSAFSNVNVDLPLHPLATGLQPVFTPPQSTYRMLFTNPDKVTVASTQNGDVIACRNHNGGKAIFVAFDFFQSSMNSDLAIANAIEWGGNLVPAPWINISPDSGSIGAYDTSTIHVSFNTAGLSEGIYTSQIHIQTNDSLQPVFIIPCTLIISDMEFLTSDSCIDFNQVILHDTVVQSLGFRNTGCDTIFISSASITSNEFFLANTIPSFILPGDTFNFQVAFYSDTMGIFNSSFQIQNSYRDTSICLLAEAIDTITNVSNLQFENVFYAYPNPASDKIYVRTNPRSEAEIVIVNITGEVVLRRTLVEETTLISLENLEAGVYFISLEAEDGKQIRELIKIN